MLLFGFEMEERLRVDFSVSRVRKIRKVLERRYVKRKSYITLRLRFGSRCSPIFRRRFLVWSRPSLCSVNRRHALTAVLGNFGTFAKIKICYIPACVRRVKYMKDPNCLLRNFATVIVGRANLIGLPSSRTRVNFSFNKKTAMCRHACIPIYLYSSLILIVAVGVSHPTTQSRQNSDSSESQQFRFEMNFISAFFTFIYLPVFS